DEYEVERAVQRLDGLQRGTDADLDALRVRAPLDVAARKGRERRLDLARDDAALRVQASSHRQRGVARVGPDLENVAAPDGVDEQFQQPPDHLATEHLRVGQGGARLTLEVLHPARELRRVLVRVARAP